MAKKKRKTRTVKRGAAGSGLLESGLEAIRNLKKRKKKRLENT